jgi:hypothetical protein
MGAETQAHIDSDLKRDAWCFHVGDVLTIREGRKIIRRETIPKQYHGWDTSRNVGKTEPFITE